MLAGSRRGENNQSSSAPGDHMPFTLTNRDCLINLMNLSQEVHGASFVLRSDGEVRLVSESEEKCMRLVDLGHMIRVTVEAPPKRTDSEWPKSGGWTSFETFVRTLLITLCDICCGNSENIVALVEMKCTRVLKVCELVQLVTWLKLRGSTFNLTENF